jgi:hypothetical protein
VALNWNIAESVAIRTLGLKVIRPTLNELYRAERCRDLAEEYRLIAAMCASTEMRDHYSRISEHYRTLAEDNPRTDFHQHRAPASDAVR